MNRRTRPLPSAPHGFQVIQWVGWADEDYLAARGLLLRGFLLQGTILANTAIEKYLKGALVARKVTFRTTHNVTDLYGALKSSGTVATVNLGFLKTLGKAYKLRYPDDLSAGFNIALAQAKILAELDSTVRALRERFVFQRTDNRAVTTKLDYLLANNDPVLLERNIAFGGYARAELFAHTHCYEMRVCDDGSILEAKYEAGPISDDGVLDAEGLRPGPSIDQMNLSHIPR